MAQDSSIPPFYFQIVIDSGNFFLSTLPGSCKIRANITGVEADQIEKIVDAIIDAGPQAVDHFKRVVTEKLGSYSDLNE